MLEENQFRWKRLQANKQFVLEANNIVRLEAQGKIMVAVFTN